jgi:hypothetical protein
VHCGGGGGGSSSSSSSEMMMVVGERCLMVTTVIRAIKAPVWIFGNGLFDCLVVCCMYTQMSRTLGCVWYQTKPLPDQIAMNNVEDWCSCCCLLVADHQGDQRGRY